MQPLYDRGDLITVQHTVMFLLSSCETHEIYRVCNSEGTPYIIEVALTPLSKRYLDYRRTLDAINLPRVIKQCVVEARGKSYSALMFEFISGENLFERNSRNFESSPTSVISLIKKIILTLIGCRLEHAKFRHNKLTLDNIYIDLEYEDDLFITGLHNFTCNQFKVDSLNSDEQADFRSLGLILCQLLLNDNDINEVNLNVFTALTKKHGNKSNQVIGIIKRLLSYEGAEVYPTMHSLLLEINKMLLTTHQVKKSVATIKEIQRSGGKGFDDIAGMDELKAMLKHDVIDALNDKELYKRYGLTIPNGLLLYGPPGCGKTFFANKFAEEIGCNFISLKPSDIQSKWVNESQQNIKRIFQEAINTKPCVMFVDEIDAILPSRDNESVNHMNTSVVNEFLVQMNNCGENDVFVIAATNKPSKIDSAVLRSGRLDKKVLIPPPDLKARAGLFHKALRDRPVEDNTNFDLLASNTEGYVSSDIALICDQAARSALKDRAKINTTYLKEAIFATPPSVAKNVLVTYSQKLE